MTLIEVLEYVAFGLNLVYIWFESRNNIWCWPIGILASFVLTYIFLSSGLYSESVLMTFYIGAGFYGWWTWYRIDQKNDRNGTMENDENLLDETSTKPISITEWPFEKHIPIILLSVVGALGLYYTFREIPGVQKPLLDAFTTSFSLFATYVLAKRVLSNWIYWIVINGVTIGLYYSRGLDILALQMVIFFLMSIYGYYKWNRLYKAQPK